MGLLVPREQWRTKSAWEDYWSNYERLEKRGVHVSDSYLPTTPLLSYGFAREAFIAELKEKRRILFLGNGISREPLNYYFSGFDVTVVDVSEKACEIFTKIADSTSINVFSFLQETLSQRINYQNSDNKQALETNKFVYCPGGNLEVINADMFEWQPQIKWHYIQNKLAFLPFGEENWELLLSLYYSWLNNGGQLQICYQYFPNHPFKTIVEVAKKIGFIVKDECINDIFIRTMACQNNLAKYNRIWSEYEYTEREKERLVHDGAKMLRVI